MSRGRKQFEAKQYGRALLEFRNAQHLEPHSAEPLYQMALVYLATGDAQSAATSLMAASRLDPQHRGVKLKLAELKAANHDLAVVRVGKTEAEALVALEPGNSDALNALAVAEFRLGDQQAAIRRFKEASANSPANIRPALNLASAQIAEADNTAAEATLKSASAKNPQDPNPAIALGRLYLIANKPADAERQFQRALAIAPKSTPALVELGALYLRAGKTGEADRIFRSLAANRDRTFRTVYALFLARCKRMEDAIQESSRLYAADPGDREARTLLVNLLRRAGRRTRAEEIIKSAIQKNSSDADALQQKSEFDFDHGDLDAAEKDLRAVLRQRSDSADTHYALARVYRAENRLSEGEELGEALRIDPHLTAARVDLARFYLAHKRTAAALSVLDEAPQTDPDNADLAVARNTALLALNRVPEVRASLDRELAKGRLPGFLIQDGLLRIRMHDFAGARRSLAEALNQLPGDSAALNALALTYIAENNRAGALAAVQRFVEQHSSAAGLVVTGQLLESNGRRAEAADAYQRAIRQSPSDLPASLDLAQLQMTGGHVDQAAVTLQKLAVTHPREPMVHLRLGMTYEAGQRFPEAIEEYRRTIDIDSENILALNNLAYVLSERENKPNDALRWAQQASEAAPDNAVVADTLGWIYFRTGLYDNARGPLELAAKSNLPLAQYHLALLYVKTGQEERGSSLLSSVLKAHPDLDRQEHHQ